MSVPLQIIIGCVLGAIIVGMLVGITRMLLESRQRERHILSEVQRTRREIPATTTMTFDHSLPPQHENSPCADVKVPEEVKQIRFIRIRKKA